MINTNALLSVGLALVGRFTEIVYVPPQGVPQATNDLQKYVLGNPFIATNVDLYLVHRRGTEFWTHDGAVDRFRTPGALFYLQYADTPTRLARFFGTPRFSSNQVVDLATTTLRRLTVHGDPLKNRPLLVQPGEIILGKQLPYYTLTWQDTNNVSGYVAQVEIDARDDWITWLDLRSTNFFDYVLAAEIRDRVYKPEPPRPQPAPKPRKRKWPRPSTNEVVRTLGAWLRVCQEFQINPGGQTNLADVDWEWSDLVTNLPVFYGRTVCQVSLENGTEIESMDEALIIWEAWDECYGTRANGRKDEDWRPFVGKIAYHWQDLAKKFETTLINKFGFPRTIFTEYNSTPEQWRSGNGLPRADPYQKISDEPPAIGTEAIARMVVSWDKWPTYKLKPGEFYSTDEAEPGWRVEFDLSTGRIKMFEFLRNRNLMNLFLRAQCKWK
ncbi:MAG: hypothetical protein ACYDH9_16300 [Limisphaerales bacterium]